MTRLLLATRSRGKAAEFRRLLSPHAIEVVLPEEINLPETPHEHSLERFQTFEENARAKAEWFATQSGMTALADDSGLEVDALGGEPGVRSKRFAGLDGPDEQVTLANNAVLLIRLAGLPAAKRRAQYRCVLVLHPAELESPEVVVEGVTHGVILEAPRGNGGFGYDPLFLSNDLGITFAEAAPHAKDEVSHRGRALAELLLAIRGD